MCLEIILRLFSETEWKRPVFEGVDFQVLPNLKREWIEREFLREEVEEAVSSCEGAKALGPDEGRYFCFCIGILRECTYKLGRQFIIHIDDSKEGKSHLGE